MDRLSVWPLVLLDCFLQALGNAGSRNFKMINLPDEQGKVVHEPGRFCSVTGDFVSCLRTGDITWFVVMSLRLVVSTVFVEQVKFGWFTFEGDAGGLSTFLGLLPN